LGKVFNRKWSKDSAILKGREDVRTGEVVASQTP